MDVALDLTGTVNGTPLATTGRGRLDLGAGRCVLEIGAPPLPLRWDPVLVVPQWLDGLLLAGPWADDLPISASGFVLVQDDQGREVARVSTAAYVLREEETVRVRAQVEGGRVRFEVLERVVRVDPPQYGDVLDFGWGSSVLTSAWTLGSARGSEYQVISTTIVDWPAGTPTGDRKRVRFESAALDRGEARVRLSLDVSVDPAPNS